MSFEVDLDELRRVVDGLQAFDDVLDEQLSRLAGVVDKLHGSWAGAAADAQRTAHERWTAGAAEMHEALGKLRAAAEHAHGCYSAAADANASMWAQTR
ncbi:MAG: ESAT-6-like protein [Nocardioides sp.]|nr:ESAT-6-like protein [Nocardioides sp.]